ncbi:DUF1254 domain-containing protein [Saccharothrix sp. ST-888]|uniref:DUF1254 domain-containing protein n=1 Tax=Saccharothrix sp. ST-888 TaxID=1427391 RepID=UPI00061EEBFC|nr:DUF1254 domain-containing protein [Saccharothrix sp. ST-888]KJK58317.1 hypothetical protein UK12_10975 [Saccharothrix sp. ST-888]
MGNPALVDPATIRETAAEAWIWGCALLENYRIMYAQAVDDADPRFVGGFGVFRHYRNPFAPADVDLVATGSDTPYSCAWLDLRAEPWVLEVPAMDRYYVLAVHDLDTSYVGFIGSRTTGQAAGRYLITGPHAADGSPPGPVGDHQGPEPGGDRQGFDGVLRADTELVGILGRTYLAGPQDAPELQKLQAQYLLTPLSAHLGTPPPPARPEPHWPVWRNAEVLETLEFFVLLDFLLGFFPVLPTEAGLRNRLSELDVGAGDFEPAALPLDVREAMLQGIADGRARLAAETAKGPDSTAWFGTRAQLGSDYLARAVGARQGRYGLPVEEVWCTDWLADDQGNSPLDAAAHRYTLDFPAGQLPPARFFWSVAMYRLPERLLVPNPAGRHTIGSHTPGLVYGKDGSLTLFLRRERPTDPAEAANWLPAPGGPFTIVLRVYGPEPPVLDGRWQLPQLNIQEPQVD